MKARTNNAVWLEKYGRWQLQIQIDGQRKTFYSSIPGAAGKRECNAKADAYIRTGVAPTVKRVKAVADEWLETLKPIHDYQSSANYKQYESIMRTRVTPIIGMKKISDLCDGDIQRVIDAADRDGLSKKSLMNIRGCCVAMLKYARKNRYTDFRIEDVTIRWDAPKAERKVLQPDALAKLMSNNTIMKFGKPAEDYYVYACRFLVATGMRPGEMLARTEADVKDGCLTISSALNVDGEITRGKNGNAVRKIKLTPIALQILADQRQAKKRFGITSTLLFPSMSGTYMNEKSLYKRWMIYQESNGIDHVSLYELRHTFVSICAESVPDNLLKMVVGHSEAMDTTGVYGHELNGQMERAAAAIWSSFNSAIKTM